jgi:hypothetical protein
VPRGMTARDRDVLVDGVPEWMVPALTEWVVSQTTRPGYAGTQIVIHNLLHEYDLVRRKTPLFSQLIERQDIAVLFRVLDNEERLDFVDWLISRSSRSTRDGLEDILRYGGSKWKVGTRNGANGLELRVPEGVQTAAESVMSGSTAGKLLAEAWAAAFGRTPHEEEAYEKAIKAVEEAGANVVSPANARATLGTMLRDMRAQRDWNLDLPGNSRDVAVNMIDALWTGQEGRHGGNGYRKPTPTEAEAAVLLAVPLVQWFASGAMARRA